MNSNDIETLFATLQAANPSPASELHYASVFELLTAVLLSAQATDAGVNKATRTLFVAAPTPARMLALGAEGVEATYARSACTTPRRSTCSRPAASSSTGTAARCRASARRWRRCPAWAARRPT
jgi:endonuclease III